MPCLILTGHPCVGKTSLASIIKERALQHSSGRIQSVLIVNEELACPGHTKHQCYLNSHNEKKTRGALKAKFDQAIIGDSKKDQLVILDSLNYIKGFRYELHCISKSAGEQHGVVWVLNSPQVAQEWNTKRNQEETTNGGQHAVYYTDRTMEELILRFEPPDERNRWDKPLYKVDMRPQELKQKESSKQEGEILEKSVYNMHALSDVLGNGADGAASSSGEPAAAAPKKKKAFKGFKRAPKTAKPVQATVVSASSAPVAAETPTTDAASSEAVLYPKDFLFSSQPSQEPLHPNPETSSTDNNNLPADDDNNPQEQRYQSNPRNNKGRKAPAPPPQPDPMTSVEAQVDAILDAFLLHVKPLTEGTSTKAHVAVSANALHEMDAITSSVCDAIVEQQTQGTMVGRISIVLKSSETLILDTKQRRLPLAELKRLRRQYLRWVGTHPPEDCDTEYGVAKSFVAYIEAQL